MTKGTVPLEALAMLLFGTAIVTGATGGWRGELLGVALSIRDPGRLAMLALVALTARVALTWRVRPLPQQLLALAPRVVAGALMCAAMLSWATHLSPFVGGADSYGYVSAAQRIVEGVLIKREPLSELLPYPNAIEAATPLGYVPTAWAPHSSVPAYPLGLPALMAAASLAGGPQGAFLVAPLLGMALVGLCCSFTYRRSADATLALMAGASVAVHPLVFAYAIQPMSDVPATAFFLLAMWMLLDNAARGALVRAGLAGLAASVAFLIRPALLPGAAALVLMPLLGQSRRATRAIAFAAVVAAGVALQLWSQWYLYGHPLANGYGPARELFSAAFFAANVRSYGRWFLALHGPLWIAGLLVALLRIGSVRERLVVAAPLVAASAPYALYRTYDHWETLRFVLPLLVVATIASVAGVFWIARRVGSLVGSWLTVVVIGAVLFQWTHWLAREHVFDRAIAEERFARVGNLVSRATGDSAVVLASLHSGSIRYYAGRDTLDWAKIPAGEFDATVAALRRAGRVPFVLLDGEEERAQFALRHGNVLDVKFWLPSGQVRDVRLYEAPR